MSIATLATLALAPTAHAAPNDDTSFAYTTVRGDTLIGLGARLLTEPSRWREVARANALRNPNRIGVGTVLRIPLTLLRSVAEPASVVSVAGQARGEGATPLQPGQSIAEGDGVTTGADGNVTIRLVDGTLLRLRAGSSLHVSQSRRLPGLSATQSATRLDAGRVEVEAAHVGAGMPGFRMRTPQGVLGVRGTEFRVESDVQSAVTRGEVLAGTVAFDGTHAPALPITAGYGSVIDAAGAVAAAVPLLGTIDVQSLPVLQERVLMRFSLPPTAAASAYRGQIARDASFDTVVADLTSPTPELRFAELPDGDYVLRVRAIDARGLEGKDADHRFRLKARPEAPLPSSPAPSAVVFGGHVDFAWAANAEAGSYRFQLSADPAFTSPLRDLPGLTATSASVDDLPPGTYRWRVRSIRPDGDAGPWGDARSFEVRPPPPVPQPPKVDDHSATFAWDGAPGQTFDFQLARNATFTEALAEWRLDRPELVLPLPGSGRFFVRLRVRDADGFVGPWTAPQSITLPNCLRDGSGGCVSGGDGKFELAP